MSSITYSTAAVLPSPSATRLRLTARGRGVLLSLAALPLAVGIAFAAISGGSALAAGDDGVSVGSTEFATVTVMPGDTLWSIASSIAPGADPRDVIGEITRLNLLSTGQLQVGQQLSLPAQYTN